MTDGLTINVAGRELSIQDGTGAAKFTVDTDNGNTSIVGTLGVTSATTLSNTLNVVQGADFDSTVNIDGVTTLTDTTNASTGNTFAASGALQVTGGASIARDLSVGNDLQIYGDFTVDGNQVSKGNQEFRGRVDFSKNENPSSLSDNAALMVTSGGMTVDEDVYIGSDLFIGPNNATKFTVLGATGNVSTDGTLNVTGNTTLTTLDLGSATSTGNITVGGILNVGTSVFTVNPTGGNLNMAGTLNVGGATVIDDSFNVTGATDLDSTLNVDGAATFNNTITQNSTSLFKDNVVLRGASKTLILQNGSGTDKITMQSTTGNITAAGLTTTNTLDVTSNTTIGGTLGVTGQITGNITGDLTGTADKSDLADITDTTTTDATFYPTFVSAVTGYSEMRVDSTNLTYNPYENRLTVANFRSTTDFEVQGNLTVTGALTYFVAQVGSIANHDTDALAEGTTNLYFTDEELMIVLLHWLMAAQVFRQRTMMPITCCLLLLTLVRSTLTI